MRAAIFNEPRSITAGDRHTDQGEAVRGGGAPAAVYIPQLLPDVLEGRVNPGLVLNYETDLEGIADVYVAMDERRAIESRVRVGTI